MLVIFNHNTNEKTFGNYKTINNLINTQEGCGTDLYAQLKRVAVNRRTWDEGMTRL